mgnify:CR=1 FL=1
MYDENADTYDLPEDAPELHDEALDTLHDDDGYVAIADTRWDDDPYADQYDDGRWDDDPSPYDGTYSEE